MKILYLDLNYPDFCENYSLKSPVYGGGRCVPSALLHSLNDMGHTFEIAADEKCFEGIEEKYKIHCITINSTLKNFLRNGGPISQTVFPVANYDIILHNFYGTKLNTQNTNIKDLVWLVGFGEHVNPANERIVLYNDYQNPKIYNPNTKIYKARIGVPMPEFYQERKKEDFVFSCHRQSVYFGARWIMKMAHKYQFKYICAGPKDSDFPEIMNYVDNNYVTYLGIIPQEQKTELYSKAYASTSLHFWNTPMNLSAVESLSLGTPVIAHDIGFWKSLINNGKNGFIIDHEDDIALMNALEACRTFNFQQNCWNSVKFTLSDNLMVQDYLNVFEQIIKE